VESFGGKLMAMKVQPLDPFAKWRGRGKLPGARRADEYLKRIRG
jgi:hypothetical protein